MKKSRFSEKQIIRILKEQESGQRTYDVCREHGIAEITANIENLIQQRKATFRLQLGKA